jgi:nitroreductase
MDALVQTAAPAETTAHTVALAAALIEARQTILPKRLVAPGPDASQLRQILAAAAHAPDHDRLLPWRFIVVPEGARQSLAQVFERSLRERDPLATEAQLAQAREKAFRAPVLMLAVARLDIDSAVPDTERIVSAGCAIQNMLLMATALGFGSALTSGKALRSLGLRTLFGLSDPEEPLCFVSIGTPTARKPARERPTPDNYVTQLESGGS